MTCGVRGAPVPGHLRPSQPNGTPQWDQKRTGPWSRKKAAAFQQRQPCTPRRARSRRRGAGGVHPGRGRARTPLGETTAALRTSPPDQLSDPVTGRAPPAGTLRPGPLHGPRQASPGSPAWRGRAGRPPPAPGPRAPRWRGRPGGGARGRGAGTARPRGPERRGGRPRRRSSRCARTYWGTSCASGWRTTASARTSWCTSRRSSASRPRTPTRRSTTGAASATAPRCSAPSSQTRTSAATKPSSCSAACTWRAWGRSSCRRRSPTRRGSLSPGSAPRCSSPASTRLRWAPGASSRA